MLNAAVMIKYFVSVTSPNPVFQLAHMESIEIEIINERL